MTKAEADALKAQIDYYAQLTEDRINAGEILITETDTPNVSLKVLYNEEKNCTEVRLNAWRQLKEDEVKDIKEFITKRKLRSSDYAISKVKSMEEVNKFIKDRETFYKFKPFTLGLDYAKVGPLSDRTAWATVGELSGEAKTAFREAVEKNFNRQYEIGPLTMGWDISSAIVDEAERLVSLDDLMHRFAFRGHDKIKGRLTVLSAAEVLEFAKLVRALTIQETTEGISARLKKPRWENDITPVPWVDRRPDENLILLPKDFTI